MSHNQRKSPYFLCPLTHINYLSKKLQHFVLSSLFSSSCTALSLFLYLLLLSLSLALCNIKQNLTNSLLFVCFTKKKKKNICKQNPNLVVSLLALPLKQKSLFSLLVSRYIFPLPIRRTLGQSHQILCSIIYL